MLMAMATGRMPQPRVPDQARAAAMRNVLTKNPTQSMPMPDMPVFTGVGPSAPTTGAEFRALAGLNLSLDAAQGLSPKGKYGGFTTQDQLNQAIYGEAIGQKAGALTYAADVRDFASKRLADINQALEQANTRYARTATTVPQGVSASSVDREMSFEPTEMALKYSPEQLDAYRAAMKDYAIKASAVPMQQMQMTEDIQGTPLYQYARAIATGRYGMNPYQAIGEFGPDIDVRSFEEQQDLMSMLETGMPYDAARQEAADLRAEQERDYQFGQRLEEAQAKDVVAKIESATGLSQNRLRSLTGMSNDLIYRAITQTPALPGKTANDKIRAFTEATRLVIKAFVEGDDTDKETVISDLNRAMADPALTGLAQVQFAVLRQYMTQQGGGQKQLSDALLNQLSPLIDVGSYQDQ